MKTYGPCAAVGSQTFDNVSMCLWDDLDCAADNNDSNEY